MKNKIKRVLNYIAISLGQVLGLVSAAVFGGVGIIWAEQGSFDMWLRYVILVLAIIFVVFNIKVLRNPFKEEPTKKKILIYNIVAVVLSVILVVLLLVSYKAAMFRRVGLFYFVGWMIYIPIKIAVIILGRDERRKEKEEKNKDFMIANNDDVFDI